MEYAHNKEDGSVRIMSNGEADQFGGYHAAEATAGRNDAEYGSDQFFRIEIQNQAAERSQPSQMPECGKRANQHCRP